MPTDPPSASIETAVRPLAEARFSIKELLREVDFERNNSILGNELVDQGEIGVIFKARGRGKAGKEKKPEKPS